MQREVSIDAWLPTFLPDGHHEAAFVDPSSADSFMALPRRYQTLQFLGPILHDGDLIDDVGRAHARLEQ